MFYVGSWLYQQDVIDPKHDSDSWSLPDTTAHSGHMGDTSNVEELLIKPEDMDLIPTQIQYGIDEWEPDEGFEPDYEAYNQFYPRDEPFYLRGFVPMDYWTPEWYPSGSWFYPTARWPSQWTIDPLFYPQFQFYVRDFTPRDYWTPMFYQTGNFYVRNFTPTDLWSEFYPANYD